MKLIIGTMLCASCAYGQVLVTNGDFEDAFTPGTIPGFTVVNGAAITAVEPINGSQSVRLPAVGDGIEFTVNTPAVGSQYKLTFWVRSKLVEIGGTTGIQADLLSGGALLGTGGIGAKFNLDDQLAGALMWTANSPNADIRIWQYAGQGWVDDVRLAVVPEPQHYAIIGAALLFGYVLIRRRLA